MPALPGSSRSLAPMYVVRKASDLMTQWGVCFAVYGPPGCLAGSTVLRVRRNRHLRTVTLEQEYRRLQGIPGGYGWHRRDTTIVTLLQSMDADGTITWKQVHGIVASGTRQIFALAVDGRPPILATTDHRFMTPDGYCALSDLRRGSTLVVQGRLIKPPLKERPYRREVAAFFHPDANYKMVGEYGPYGRIRYARAVLEASLNNLTVEQFLHIVNNDLRRALELRYMETGSEVHHRDNDPSNDTPDNLYALSKAEHARLHGDQNAQNFGLGRWATTTARVLDMVPIGDESTYDVQMVDDDAPNFLVNGVVTHNSGKTTLAAQAADSAHAGQVLFIDCEGGTRAVGDREDVSVIRVSDSDDKHAEGMGFQVVQQILDDLINGDLKYGTVVVDNLSELNVMCTSHVIRTVPRNVERRDLPDQKTWNTTTSMMLLLVRRFRDFAQSSGTNVIFIAWDRQQDDRVTGIAKKDLALNPALANQLPGILDIVAYLTITGKGRRNISFEASASTAAKFRRAGNEVAMTIPTELPYDFGSKSKPMKDLIDCLRGNQPFPASQYQRLPVGSTGASAARNVITGGGG